MKDEFLVGDVVAWTSQSQGYTKAKQGVIVQVVPAGERPSRDRCSSLYTGAGAGSARAATSYVVEYFDNPAKLTGRKLYWPLAQKLQLIGRSADKAGAK